MPFLIYCADDPALPPPDEALRAAHRKYLFETHKDRILAGGPTFGADGQTTIGRVMFTDHATQGDAEAFLDAEPYFKAGRVKTRVINPMRMAFPVK
jgi:uncharacterized protein YciI